MYCTPVYDRVDAVKVKSSVSMKKYNPYNKNVAVLDSGIVLLFKVVTLSKLSNVIRVVSILPLSNCFPCQME